MVLVELTAYVICKRDCDLIDRVEFTCPEINYIHPVNQAVELIMDPFSFAEKGVVTVNAPSFDITTTEKQAFNVDGKEVILFFAIARTVSTKIHTWNILSMLCNYNTTA